MALSPIKISVNDERFDSNFVVTDKSTNYSVALNFTPQDDALTITPSQEVIIDGDVKITGRLQSATGDYADLTSIVDFIAGTGTQSSPPQGSTTFSGRAAIQGLAGDKNITITSAFSDFIANGNLIVQGNDDSPAIETILQVTSGPDKDSVIKTAAASGHQSQIVFGEYTEGFSYETGTYGIVSELALLAHDVDANTLQFSGMNSITIDSDTIINGNLTVTGNTTTINSTVVTVDDLTFNLASNQNTLANIDTAGIIIGNNNVTFVYSYANTRMVLNTGLEINDDLIVDTDTLYVDSVNDRVGINNSSPILPLTIGAYTSQIGPDTTWDMTIGVEVNTNKIAGLDYKNSNTTGQVRFLARNDQDDYIVLNTFGSSNTTNFFGQQGRNVTILFSNATTDTDKQLAIGTYNNGDLLFGTYNQERMRVTKGGNVGIGTTTPISKLHVSNGSGINNTFSTYWTSNDIILSTDTSSANGVRLVRASDQATTRTSLTFIKSRGTLQNPTGLQENDIVGDLLFGGYGISGVGYAGGVFAYVDGNVGSASCPMRLSFVTGSNSQDRQERLTIKSGGNVGIGTTAPNEKLTVNGNISASGTLNTHTIPSGTGTLALESYVDNAISNIDLTATLNEAKRYALLLSM